MGGKFPKAIWVPIISLISILMVILAGYLIWSSVKLTVVKKPGQTGQEILSGTPELTSTTVIKGLSHVWDVAFAPDGTAYFTERAGDLSVINDNAKQLLERPADVVSVGGEGGMMGMTLDPDFAQNRYLYACFNTDADVRVVRWHVSGDNTLLDNRTDIITGMPRKDGGGRHSGCRPRFGTDGYLWVATGDAATGTNAQDPASLGGKILRVDRDGAPAPDNLGPPFDSRIYSYGHRNSQGLAFHAEPKNGVIGYSAEHGPDRDDEINELRPGNFGWDPVPAYNEDVPMTDKQKFPTAVEAAWSSGIPTIAPSGTAILSGAHWRDWNGALAVAALKGQHVRIFTFDEQGKVKTETKILEGLGRIRSVVMGPDSALYYTTDIGDNRDRIVKVAPK